MDIIQFVKTSLVCLLSAGCSQLPANNEPVITPANSDHIRYEGRIDFETPANPKIIWQGSTIETRFKGETLTLGFNQVKGQVFFDLEIDGKNTILHAQDGWLTPDITLEKGWHSLTLRKRSEAVEGHIGFLGITTQKGKVRSPPTSTNPLKFIFYGDSITAGACNEDGEEDQWENRRTHNSSLSYAAITAKNFNATIRNQSVSGMGISVGYQPFTTQEVWNRLYPDPTSKVIDPSTWKPNLVFVNFGENDDSFSNNQKTEFPSNYSARYTQFIIDLQSTYPDSTIIILRGGMYGGAKSMRLRGPWQEVIANLQKSHPQIKHFVFKHWSSMHPRVDDHYKMAAELTEWITSEGLTSINIK